MFAAGLLAAGTVAASVAGDALAEGDAPGAEVRVYVHAPEPFQVFGHPEPSLFCDSAPCEGIAEPVWVGPSHPPSLLVRGDFPSAKLDLRERSGDLNVAVHPGSFARKGCGISLMVLGQVVLNAGFPMLFLHSFVEGSGGVRPIDRAWQTAGYTSFAVGPAIFITGLVLCITSGTHLDVQPRRATARKPIWWKGEL